MNKILIGIDFESGTTELTEYACSLALAFNARLRLLYVAAPDPDFVGYEPGPQSVRDSRARQLRTKHVHLQKMADRLCSYGVRTDSLLVQGETATKFLEQARRWDADAVVLGNKGHGLLRKTLRGSVSEGVLKEAQCTVILVPVPSPSG